jgi:hypothetical protein
MKRYAHHLLTLTVALLPLSGWSATITTNQSQVRPPAATDSTAGLSQPAREVVKMSAAGVPDDVVKAYVENSGSTFNLTTDNIIHLQGVGVSSVVTTAMLVHDKNLRESVNAQAQAVQAAAAQQQQQQQQQNAQAAEAPVVAPPNYQDQYSAPQTYYYNQPYYYPSGYGYGDWWGPSVVVGFPFRSWCFNGFRRGGLGFHSGFNRGFNGGFHGGLHSGIGFHGSGGFHVSGGFHGGGGSHGGGHR